jgi:hypothetical protein
MDGVVVVRLCAQGPAGKQQPGGDWLRLQVSRQGKRAEDERLSRKRSVRNNSCQQHAACLRSRCLSECRSRQPGSAPGLGSGVDRELTVRPGRGVERESKQRLSPHRLVCGTGGAEKQGADCARRSPGSVLEDAGSIPATSTKGCSRTLFATCGGPPTGGPPFACGAGAPVARRTASRDRQMAQPAEAELHDRFVGPAWNRPRRIEQERIPLCFAVAAVHCDLSLVDCAWETGRGAMPRSSRDEGRVWRLTSLALASPSSAGRAAGVRTAPLAWRDAVLPVGNTACFYGGQGQGDGVATRRLAC